MELTNLGKQMLEGKEAVIFDLDGTLVDSLHFWNACYQALFEKFPTIKFDVFEFFRESAGFTLLEQAEWLVHRYNLPMTPMEVRNFWPHVFFTRFWNQLEFYPGAIDFMQWLESNGIPFAVCTAGDPSIVRFFEKSPVKPDHFLSCETFQKAKPDPFVYLEAMERMGVGPETCVIFEDSHEGLVGAKRSGSQSIGVFIRKGAARHKDLCDQHITSWKEIIQ